MKGSR